MPDLSAREIKVLQLLVNGLTNKQIGERLNCSKYTIQNHVLHIRQKIGGIGDTRTRIAVAAVRAGLV